MSGTGVLPSIEAGPLERRPLSSARSIHMSSATVQPIRKKRRPVSKRSTASARDARERIILTALELFSQFGYDAVSTIKIANAVGVSQPNIHYHFRSKRKLWEAAMFELADQIKDDALLSGQVTSIGDDALAQLKLVCSQTVRNSWRYPLLGRVVLLEGQAGGERLNWLIDNVLQEHYADIRSLIEACVEQGLIKPHDPAQLIMISGALLFDSGQRPLRSYCLVSVKQTIQKR